MKRLSLSFSILLTGLLHWGCAAPPASTPNTLDGQEPLPIAREGVWEVFPPGVLVIEPQPAADVEPHPNDEVQNAPPVVANSDPEEQDSASDPKFHPTQTLPASEGGANVNLDLIDDPSQGESSSTAAAGPRANVDQAAEGLSLSDLRPHPDSPSAGCFLGGCHGEVIIQVGEYFHQPFADGTCDVCHSVAAVHPEDSGPHVSSLRDIELCQECHPDNDLGTSHPVDQELIDVNTGQLFTCTSTCHNPHIAPYPGLLRLPGGGALCMSCHKDDF